MEIKYIHVGDYYIPDLKLPDNSQQPIGKYGRMRMAYLKEHRPIIYKSTDPVWQAVQSSH